MLLKSLECYAMKQSPSVDQTSKAEQNQLRSALIWKWYASNLLPDEKKNTARLKYNSFRGETKCVVRK